MSLLHTPEYLRGRKTTLQRGYDLDTNVTASNPRSLTRLLRKVAKEEMRIANGDTVAGDARFRLKGERQIRWEAVEETPDLRDAIAANHEIFVVDPATNDFNQTLVTDALMTLELEGKTTVEALVPALREYAGIGLPDLSNTPPLPTQ